MHVNMTRCIKLFCLSLFVIFSINVDARKTSNSKNRMVLVDAIILHAIGGPYCGANKIRYSGAKGNAKRWYRFFEDHPVLGVHYIIDREGLVISQISDSKVANHTLGWNENSIGIELVNNGDHQDEYSGRQMKALLKLVKGLRVKYPLITKKRVLRHSDVDTRMLNCVGEAFKRKQDPGDRFDYKALLNGL